MGSSDEDVDILVGHYLVLHIHAVYMIHFIGG